MADDTPRHDPVNEAADEGGADAPTFAEYLDLQGTARNAGEGAGDDRGELVGAATGAPSMQRTATDALPTWSFPETARRRSSRLPLFEEAEAPAPSTPGVEDATRRVQPMFGPVGVSRSPVAVVLLAVVTAGLYALRWSARIDNELEDFDPQLSARSRRGTLALAIPWVLGLLTSVAGGVILLVDRAGGHLPGGIHVAPPAAAALLAGLAVVPYLVVLLPFSLVTAVMRLERMRCVEEHVGMTSDRQVRPVGLSLLLVVPVAGGLVLLARKQGRANAIWESVTPARPGRR